jgi:hypothetical protein
VSLVISSVWYCRWRSFISEESSGPAVVLMIFQCASERARQKIWLGWAFRKLVICAITPTINVLIYTALLPTQCLLKSFNVRASSPARTLNSNICSLPPLHLSLSRCQGDGSSSSSIHNKQQSTKVSRSQFRPVPFLRHIFTRLSHVDEIIMIYQALTSTKRRAILGQALCFVSHAEDDSTSASISCKFLKIVLPVSSQKLQVKACEYLNRLRNESEFFAVRAYIIDILFATNLLHALQHHNDNDADEQQSGSSSGGNEYKQQRPMLSSTLAQSSLAISSSKNVHTAIDDDENNDDCADEYYRNDNEALSDLRHWMGVKKTPKTEEKVRRRRSEKHEHRKEEFVLHPSFQYA